MAYGLLVPRPPFARVTWRGSRLRATVSEMAAHQHPPAPTYSAAELELAREGTLRLRTRSIAEVLVELGPPPVDTTDAGTAALQDVRDDRV